MRPDEINPRWVLHTLVHRGLPSIGVEALQFGLKTFTAEQSKTFRAKILRLQNGAEQGSDMDAVADWARTTKSAFTEAYAVPIPVAVDPENALASEEHPDADAPGVYERPVIATEVAADPERIKRLHPENLTRVRDSHHVYGAKAALCIEPALIEDIGLDQRTPAFHTLSIEMAPSSGDRHYNWDNKIVFRLTKREMPLFVSVMMGWISIPVRMANHGNDRDKTLEITDQGGGIFVKLRQARRVLAIPMPAEEVFAVCTLALTTLARNTPLLDTQTLVLVTRRAAAMYNKQEGPI